MILRHGFGAFKKPNGPGGFAAKQGVAQRAGKGDKP
jgi:hypothetical protein